MNCDEVFLHLTGIETGANGTLDRHLADCPSCRQMAARFRPAVALFDTDARDEEMGEVPARWQHVWETVAVADRAAAQLRRRSARAAAAPWRRWGWIAHTAATLLIGGLLGAVVTRAEGPGAAEAPLPQAGAGATANAARCELLVAFFRETAEQEVCPTCHRPLATPASRAVALCKVCHTPQKQGPNVPLISDAERFPG